MRGTLKRTVTLHSTVGTHDTIIDSARRTVKAFNNPLYA